MRKMFFAGVSCLVLLLAVSVVARAHCEIPCGIYGDEMRVRMIAEHIGTIEKSMRQIEGLAAEDHPNFNQLVRWVDNKEKHADEIQEIVSQYFLTQRIKPADPEDEKARAKYVEKLTLLHKIMIQAMKAKQSTDLEVVTKLRALLDSFSVSEFGHKVQ